MNIKDEKKQKQIGNTKSKKSKTFIHILIFFFLTYFSGVCVCFFSLSAFFYSYLSIFLTQTLD